MEETKNEMAMNEARRRLTAIEGRLEKSWAPTTKQTDEILDARARFLARQTRTAVEKTEELDVVEFLLAYEHYGIATSFVHEVFPLVELTVLPGTPQFVLGVANVRGRIYSVVDIKRFFDLPDKGLTNLNQLILVRHGDMELGILADEVLGVRSIALSDLHPPLPTMTGIRAEYLRGLTVERLAVLDTERFLSDRKIVVE